MSDVVVVRWPHDAARVDDLRGAGTARLLLVEPTAPPPEIADPLEDWVRMPASEEDVKARIRGLEFRLGVEQARRPVLDADGILHLGGRSVVLPPVEARLAAELVDRMGSVVPRDVLTRAGWPEGVPNRNLLDVRILRLRRRLETLGIEVRTVRHRGYLMQLIEE
ncbi:MAG: winged helix-turn-helix domain-containing protein [Actinomycetota bacterium]